MRTYKSTVFLRLPYHPGGDFAVIEVQNCGPEAAAILTQEVLANKQIQDYDWRYSPIMLFYDYELEYPTKSTTNLT